MRAILKKAALFLIVNTALYALYYAAAESRYRPQDPGRTGHVLYFFPKNEPADLVFTGSSHGQVFRTSGNQARVEKILNRKIVNLSVGGSGAVTANMMLDYYFGQKNKTKTVVMLVDFFGLQVVHNNEGNPAFRHEPLRLSILPYMFRHRLDFGEILGYFTGKVSRYYWDRRIFKEEDTQYLKMLDLTEVKQRVAGIYRAGLSRKRFERYTKILEEAISRARANDAEVVIVLPPATFQVAPKTAEGTSDWLIEYLNDLKKRENVSFHDCRAALQNLRYFYDTDHLNTPGVVHFTQNHLRPILDGRPACSR